MSIKITSIITAFVVLICIVVGLINKTSYSDIRELENPFDDFEVSVCSSDLFDSILNSMDRQLTKSPQELKKEIDLLNLDQSDKEQAYSEIPKCILRVKCVDKPSFEFLTYKQTVTIQKIYVNDGLKKDVSIKEGNDIDVILASGLFFIPNEKDSQEAKSVNVSYTQLMQENEEYLIFIYNSVETFDKNHKVYNIDSPLKMMPYFCYSENKTSTPFGTNETQTNFTYGDVKESEFFLSSQSDKDKMYDFKQKLFELYPQ